MQSVHSVHLLDELVKGVPAQCVHLDECLQSVEEKEGSGVVLHFKNGMTAMTDGVIGADRYP